MITEQDIPGIVAEINLGGEKPTGVEPVHLSRKTLKYTHVYFLGLGVFDVTKATPELVLSEEHSLILKQQNNAE